MVSLPCFEFVLYESDVSFCRVVVTGFFFGFSSFFGVA